MHSAAVTDHACEDPFRRLANGPVRSLVECAVVLMKQVGCWSVLVPASLPSELVPLRTVSAWGSLVHVGGFARAYWRVASCGCKTVHMAFSKEIAAVRDLVIRLVPGNPLPLPRAPRTNPFNRVQKPSGIVQSVHTGRALWTYRSALCIEVYLTGLRVGALGNHVVMGVVAVRVALNLEELSVLYIADDGTSTMALKTEPWFPFAGPIRVCSAASLGVVWVLDFSARKSWSYSCSCTCSCRKLKKAAPLHSQHVFCTSFSYLLSMVFREY